MSAQMSMFAHDPADSEWDRVEGDPSPYEQHLEQQRQAGLLQRQIQKYGDEQMRVGCALPVGHDSVEPFQRSYHLKMPDAKKDGRPDKPDPCKKLLKAMKITMMDQKAERRHAY